MTDTRLRPPDSGQILMTSRLKLRDVAVVVLVALRIGTTTVALGGGDRRATGPAVPVALCWSNDGRLRVALRDAREVVDVDVSRRTVVERHPLPFRPVSLTTDRDRSTVLVGGVDGEMLAMRPDGTTRTFDRFHGRGPARAVVLDNH